MIALLIFIWIATFIHARVVIRDSIQIAIKQGAVLGKDTVSFRSLESSGDLSEAIRSFREVGGVTNPFLKLIGFRPDNPTYPIESTYNTILSTATMRNTRTEPFVRLSGGIKNVPPEYLYSMALIYEGIRGSLGTGNLLYPCSMAELKTKPGCMVCLPILRSVGAMGVTTIPSKCLPRNSLSIQCSYHASFPVLSKVSNLFKRILGGGGVSMTPIIDEAIEGYATNANVLIGNERELIERTGCSN